MPLKERNLQKSLAKNMNLLLDANLSWRLLKPLSKHFQDIRHVDNIGLATPPKDFEIWKWAKYNNFIIITNDEDFIPLTLTKGFPPKIIILKIGNQSNNHILELLISRKNEIIQFEQSTNTGLLEIY